MSGKGAGERNVPEMPNRKNGKANRAKNGSDIAGQIAAAGKARIKSDQHARKAQQHAAKLERGQFSIAQNSGKNDDDDRPGKNDRIKKRQRQTRRPNQCHRHGHRLQSPKNPEEN